MMEHSFQRKHGIQTHYPEEQFFFLKAQNTLCINVPLAPLNFYLPLASGDNISNKHPKITNYFYRISIES